MERILWINPAVGIAGDMLFGALIDLGAGENVVRAALDRLDLPGWELRIRKVHRRGVLARRAQIEVEDTEEHRPWSTIDSLLRDVGLPARVADGARLTFRRLAEVEAERHGVELDEVIFHELGAVDALIDVVGCWTLLEALHVDEVRSGAVGLGAGVVNSSHGSLPHPAPATLGLLAGLPVHGVDTPFETATPTGTALLATMVDRWGPAPAGRLESFGYGAGGRDTDSHANILGVLVVETDETATIDAVLIETTTDDVTPEVLGHVIDRALAEGADDAWIVPVVMKKSRPGHQIRILCAPALESRLIELVAAETGSLGLRRYPVSKRVLPRHLDQVDVAGGTVRIKVGPHGAKPEFEDVLRIATATNRNVRSVAAEALALWAEQGAGRGPPEDTA